MPKMRREFSPEFKRETVALLEASRQLLQAANEVGSSPSVLRNWRTMIDSGTVRSKAAVLAVSPLLSPADQASEIARLKLVEAVEAWRFAPLVRNL